MPNASGGTDRWSVECNSPNNLAKQGWRSTSLKPGDKVTIVIHPLRNGDKGGSFMYVKLADGTVLTIPPIARNPSSPAPPARPTSATAIRRVRRPNAKVRGAASSAPTIADSQFAVAL